MLPAAGVLDHGLPQNSGGAVEVEKPSAAGTRHVLEDKMAVEQHGLHFGQHVIVAVSGTPPGRHPPPFWGGRKSPHSPPEINCRRRDHVGRRPYFYRLRDCSLVC